MKHPDGQERGIWKTGDDDNSQGQLDKKNFNINVTSPSAVVLKCCLSGSCTLCCI